MFKNEMLQKITNAMPANREKFDLVMLFVVIDGYLNGAISEANFIHDLPLILKETTYSEEL